MRMSKAEQIKSTEVQATQGRVVEDVNRLKVLPGLVLDYPEDVMNDLIKSVEYSYKKYGKLARPVVISKDRYILDGNAVSLAAKRLGIQHVDVYELPVTCSDNPAICLMWYDVLNRVNRAQKDRLGTVARRRALFELVLRYLANLPEDSYAELMQEMQNDTVPTVLINFIRNLAPLSYKVVYYDLELFIVHPQLFRAMARVRHEDVKRIMASISDTVFTLSYTDIDSLKELPREVREKAINGNGTVKESLPTPVPPPPQPPIQSTPLPPPPSTAPVQKPQPSVTSVATTPAVVAKPSPSTTTATTPTPQAQAKVDYVEANLEVGRQFLEHTKEDVDRYFRSLEMFVEENDREKFEKSYNKALSGFVKNYYVFGYRTIFEDTKLNGLRAMIYSTVLGGFEDIMVTLRNDIAPYRNTRLEEMLSKMFEAVSEGTVRVGMAGARGPRGMVPWLASVMCQLLKTLDTFGDNYYRDGVDVVCRDVENAILRKFDALIAKR